MKKGTTDEQGFAEEEVATPGPSSRQKLVKIKTPQSLREGELQEESQQT